MAKGPTYSVRYRRRREQKTSYRRRLALLKSGRPRIAVRPSNKHIRVQAIRYDPDGDVIVSQSHSSDLAGYGWRHATGNIPAAYLTGFLFGTHAKKLDADDYIFDAGLANPAKGSRTYAALKGVVDAGVSVRAGDDIYPVDERLAGKHIQGHRKEASSMDADIDAVKKAIDAGKKREPQKKPAKKKTKKAGPNTSPSPQEND